MCGSLSAEYHYRIEFPAEETERRSSGPKPAAVSKEAVETPAPAAKVETPAEKAYKSNRTITE